MSDSLVLVCDDDAEDLLASIANARADVSIEQTDFANFIAEKAPTLGPTDHVLIRARLAELKQVLEYASERGFSVGVLPGPSQDRLRRYLDLPSGFSDSLDLALETDNPAIDLVRCNSQIMLFRAAIGWMPMLDASEDLNRWSFIKRIFSRYARLRLYPYTIHTANERQVDTAASGCMIVQRHEGDLVSRLLGKQLSVSDGKVGVMVASPFSLMEYLKFLRELFFSLRKSSGLPSVIGYLESRSFRIDSDKVKEVTIDGEVATQTLVEVSVTPAALRLNVGPGLREGASGKESDKETIRIDNLRTEKELSRSIGSRVPFFSYASEERFRDLFTALFEDAEIHTNYVVFMLLSTLIATLGLYLNSAAVIIGAMILAPLMAPMVCVSMALLRDNEKLLRQSLDKIGLGILLALGSSALVAALIPYSPITTEMMGRLNPSLPDLFVAILSGIAAAYARSFKEIAQNLAGVAIAVALVPPLAVAGIGLGRGEFAFFLQAFLLFSTNLVGIVLAATVTFRVLGFSPSMRSKHGIGFVALLLVLVAIPLGITSSQIAARWDAEEKLENREFSISGKDVRISGVTINGIGGMTANVLVDGPLDEKDLFQLRELIHDRVGDEVEIELDVHYRL